MRVAFRMAMGDDMAAEWIGAPVGEVRAITTRDTSTEGQAPPTTFDAIPEPASVHRCARCGKGAKYRFTMFVKPDGRKATALVSRTYAICEPCGAFIVFSVQRAFDK